MDIFSDQAANDEAYFFWRNKICERVHDPMMQEKLAPTSPPYPFGSKRPSLEINYYDVCTLGFLASLIGIDDSVSARYSTNQTWTLST